MKTKKAYSIRYRDEKLTVLGVTRLEKDRWRLDHLEQNQGTAGPSVALASEMAGATNRVTMLVSAENTHTALVSLPRLKRKELGLAASGWVAREQSSRPDQWRVSWREWGPLDQEKKKDQTRVFMLYAERQVVAEWTLRAGTVGRILPDYMILDGMFRRYYPEVEELEAWNVVFVSQDDHFLCVANHDGLLLTRPLPVDLSEGQDAGEYLDRLATEVDRSVFFARQTEMNPNVQRIVVCGQEDLARGLVERLGQATSVPSEFWDVASRFESSGRKLDASLLLPAMAAAQADRPSPFNLLPKQPRTLFSPVVRHRLALAGTTAAVVVIPLLAIGGAVTAKIQDHYLNRARERMQTALVKADEAKEVYIAQKVLLAKDDRIEEITGDEQDYAGVLLHLAALTPRQVIYDDLRLKETSDQRLVLYLSGQSNADTVEEAQQSFLTFQGALKHSRLLVSAGEPRKLLIRAEKNKGLEVNKVEFSMEYQVRPAAPVPVEAATVASRMEN